MERDILKKRRPSLRRRAREVYVHPRGQGPVPGGRPVQRSRRIDEWILRVDALAQLASSSGRPRILADLRVRGERVSDRRVARLMRKAGLASVRQASASCPW